MNTCSRRAITGLLALAIAISIVATLTAQTNANGSRFEDTIGFSLPTIGTIHYDNEGHISKATGFNLGLGISRRFYRDGLIPEEFNRYWGWGTVLLLLPYVEFGVSYPFVVGEKENLLVLDLGFVYILPRIGISLIF